MKRLVGTLGVCAMVIGLGCVGGEPQAAKKSLTSNAKSQMTNNRNKVWIYRHAVGDKNLRSQALAIKVYFAEPANDGTINGTLRFWTRGDTSGYSELHKYTLGPLAVTNAGEA